MQTTTQHMRMPRTVAQALMFLERHGHSPIMTPDGILVVSPCRLMPEALSYAQEDAFTATPMPIKVIQACEECTWLEPDCWIDEAECFPVAGNVVDLAPIREWQGY